MQGNQDACGTYSQDLFVNQTKEYIKERAADGKPFFAWLSVVTPHEGNCKHPTKSIPGGPYAVPFVSPEYKQYEGQWKDEEVDYASAVTQMDAAMGAVVQQLKDSGLDDNTVVIMSEQSL